MNTSVNTIYSSHKANIYTAFMYALAVMLLVVSCPVKRLLQNNIFLNSSTSIRSNQTNISQRTGADYNDPSICCAAKKKTILVKLNLPRQVKLPAPLHLPNISNQPGFDLNYFSSGLSYHYPVIATSFLSAVPLFQRHLRMLI